MEQTRISVLDRLLGNSNDEFTINDSRQEDTIIQNVRRDLQDLLNTRKVPMGKVVNDSPILKESLLNYGIADFASFNPESSTDRQRLKVTLENLVSAYEPRLKQVKVKLLKNTDKLDFRVRFHIDAVLCIESIVMPVQFNSIMETSPPHFDIKDAHYE